MPASPFLLIQNTILFPISIDFLYGTIYAIGGDLQKLGGGIFLCTPNNVTVDGKISEDNNNKHVHSKKDGIEKVENSDTDDDFF